MPTSKLVFSIATAGPPAPPLDLDLDLEGHLFDARGKHIASAAIEAGRLVLELPTARLRRASLWISPKHPNAGQPTLEMMRRLHAYQPTVTLRPGAAIELRIPEDLWPRWRLCLTRVVGRVVRPMEIAGQLHELPVCHARVHICEADPLPMLFRRLPDLQLLRVRDELLRLHEGPVPSVPPVPLDHGPMLTPRVELVRGARPWLQVGAVRPMMGAPRQPFASLMMTRAELRELSEVRKLFGEELRVAPTPRITLPTTLRDALASPSPAVIRTAMNLHLETIIPLLCWWPWIWPFIQYDEMQVVETDAQGRFEALIIYSCGGDKPDIYSWVEYSINGVWTPVYKPPAVCTTRWNYVSGTEVILRVRDPRVPWCEEPQAIPGKQVAVITLGNKINVHQVDQTSGLAPGGRPLGGSIEPTLWFGEDLQQGNGATHYKWSYRRVYTDMTPAESWHNVDDLEVGRHYGVITATNTILFKSFKLGPDEAVTSDSLYKIQPKDPPTGSWAPQLNARANTASAYLVSGTQQDHKRLPDGYYELKLELFNNTGAGPVRVADVDFQMPPAHVAAPFPTNMDLALVPAPSAYLIEEAGRVIAFRMVIRIDNNDCDAVIHQAVVPGSTQECGFISFDATLPASMNTTLGFEATHLNDFASLSFSVYRGSCLLDPLGAAGNVGVSPLSGYTLESIGVYRRTLPTTSLLGAFSICPETCTNGAFAEHLHVNALATDGWGDLDYLDAHAVAAFALAT